MQSIRGLLAREFCGVRINNSNNCHHISKPKAYNNCRRVPTVMLISSLTSRNCPKILHQDALKKLDKCFRAETGIFRFTIATQWILDKDNASKNTSSYMPKELSLIFSRTKKKLQLIFQQKLMNILGRKHYWEFVA